MAVVLPIRAQVTLTELSDDGESVVVHYTLSCGDRILGSSTITVGVTAEADHVRETLANRARTMGDLLSLPGETIDGEPTK